MLGFGTRLHRSGTAPAPHRASAVAAVIAALMVQAGLGCTHTPAPESGSRYYYFADPSHNDAWFDKISDWQQRERGPEDLAAEPLPLPTGTAYMLSRERAVTATLQEKYSANGGVERRELAQRFMTWSQIMAREHYRKDGQGTDDPWPTTAELLAQGGDDCDGLDLLAYGLMRDFGFERHELFRAIVRRERDRANHMVTLWFEDGSDPWVIDATGAISLGLRRMSDLEGWVPTRVFNEFDQYTVVQKLPPDGG
jgi:hypothetical protein